MKDIVLVVILLFCAVTDLKSGKIYNMVIAPGLILAFLFSGVTGGWEALGQSFLGFAVGLGLLLVPFLLGGMGAGDVKLLGLVGAFQGPVFCFRSFILAALVGGVMAIGIMIYRSGFLKIGRGFLPLLGLFFSAGGKKIAFEANRKGTFPYGVAIVLGTLGAYMIG